MSTARTTENIKNATALVPSPRTEPVLTDPLAVQAINRVDTSAEIEANTDTAPDHRLRWPEALAITLALLLGGAVAAGAFRPMLPWLG